MKFCDGQVNNRDMSIAVLRTFISKRKKEHEALLTKKLNKTLKVSEDHDSELEAPSESTIPNGKSNGDECEEMQHDEPCGTSEEPEKIPEGKGRRVLKPPRVLEVSNLYTFVPPFVSIVNLVVYNET